MKEHRIDLKIREESELYNPLDPSGFTLSDEVVSYILDKFQDRTIGDKIILHIFTEEEVDEAHAREVFLQWLETEVSRNKRERKRNNIQMARLLIIGAIIIAISIAIQIKVNAVWYTIVSTIGAFSIWEASNIWIIKNPKLKLDKRVIRKVSEEVEIVFEKV